MIEPDRAARGARRAVVIPCDYNFLHEIFALRHI
jgi:hypothetical protein